MYVYRSLVSPSILGRFVVFHLMLRSGRGRTREGHRHCHRVSAHSAPRYDIIWGFGRATHDAPSRCCHPVRAIRPSTFLAHPIHSPKDSRTPAVWWCVGRVCCRRYGRDSWLARIQMTTLYLTNRWSQRPHFEISSECLPRHPAVAYLFLVRRQSPTWWNIFGAWWT